MTRLCTRVALIALMLQVASPARCQSTDEGSVFDFSLPGARSRAMGGAFVAIADDASAIYSNPAGLTSLFRPEISVEGRAWRLRFEAISSGHAYGMPSNRGVDTVAGAQYEVFKKAVSGPAFFSAVYPSGRWAVGLFHHQLANYRMAHQTEGVFFDCKDGLRGPFGYAPFCELAGGVDRVFPAKQDYEVAVDGTGIGLALQLSSRLRVGGSVQLVRFQIEREGFVYNARRAHQFAPADMSAENLESRSVRSGRDRRIGLNVGAIWDVSDTVSVGGTFRQGSTFRYSAYTVSGPQLETEGQVFIDKVPPFRVPDTWAAGIAFKPNNSWRIGFEYDRVRYRQLRQIVANTTLPEKWPETALLKERLTIDDSNQFRAGAEYSRPAPRSSLLSIRAGVWSDPFHQLYIDGADPESGFPLPAWTLLFPKRDGQIHLSGGLGIATSRRLQVDFGVDHARTVTTYSLSSIVRF